MKTMNQFSQGKFIPENPVKESVKRFADSFQVLVIGLLLPFLFAVGVSHDDTKIEVPKEIRTDKNNYVQYNNNTIDFGKILAADNS